MNFFEKFISQNNRVWFHIGNRLLFGLTLDRNINKTQPDYLERTMMLYRTLLTSFLSVSISTSALAGPPEVNSEISAKYPGPWETDFNMQVTKALSQSGARGCGIIIYRVSRDSNSEYLAACSTDNENWQAYMVWPNIGEVMGPYTLE